MQGNDLPQPLSLGTGDLWELLALVDRTFAQLVEGLHGSDPRTATRDADLPLTRERQRAD